jgi:hypothetical protein
LKTIVVAIVKVKFAYERRRKGTRVICIQTTLTHAVNVFLSCSFTSKASLLKYDLYMQTSQLLRDCHRFLAISTYIYTTSILAYKKRTCYVLRALSLDTSFSLLIIFLLGNPHLLEGTLHKVKDSVKTLIGLSWFLGTSQGHNSLFRVGKEQHLYHINGILDC